jgi:hypothetical protein
MLNMVLLYAYLGLGEGWLVILLLIVVLSIVAGIVFIGLGIRRLSQASGPRRMGVILLVLGGILLPILCFFGGIEYRRVACHVAGVLHSGPGSSVVSGSASRDVRFVAGAHKRGFLSSLYDGTLFSCYCSDNE